VVHHAAALRFLPAATRLRLVKRALGPFGLREAGCAGRFGPWPSVSRVVNLDAGLQSSVPGLYLTGIQAAARG